MITVRAPAKLTVTLRVTGVREDGYHLIDAEMVTIDLADVLSITPGGDGVTVGGPFSAGVPTDDSNLVVQALLTAGRRAAVHIDKHIPHGGGLGGGSADAAAVLRWARPGDTSDSWLAAAASLGADVPFCVLGGRARVRGIGEIVDRLPFRPLTFTLVVPPVPVATPAVYRAWDELGAPAADGDNDLEPAALAHWRDRIGELAGTVPVLAGSGGTWFVTGERDDALAALRSEGAAVVVARTVGAG